MHKTVETKCFHINDKMKIFKELDDLLGLDYETTEVDNYSNKDSLPEYFSVTVFEVLPKEIDILRGIENKFDAVDIDEATT